MFKKLVLTSLLFLLQTTTAMAGAVYVGASMGEVTNTSNTASSNFRGLPFSVNLGYGNIFSDSFYFGGELFTTLGTVGFEDNGLASTYNYGLSFIPGLLLGDHSMIYGRAGVVRTRFTPSGGTGTGLNSNVTGGQLGLGLQLGLTQNLDLRGEYVFSAYTSFHSIDSPRQDQFNLGVIYRFE